MWAGSRSSPTRTWSATATSHPTTGASSPTKNRDLLILAGDIGTGLGAYKFIDQELERSPVVYVLGNHEHYVGETHGEVEAEWARIDGTMDGLHVLQAEAREVAGWRIWGGPAYSDLWGDDTETTRRSGRGVDHRLRRRGERPEDVERQGARPGVPAPSPAHGATRRRSGHRGHPLAGDARRHRPAVHGAGARPGAEPVLRQRLGRPRRADGRLAVGLGTHAHAAQPDGAGHQVREQPEGVQGRTGAPEVPAGLHAGGGAARGVRVAGSGDAAACAGGANAMRNHRQRGAGSRSTTPEERAWAEAPGTRSCSTTADSRWSTVSGHSHRSGTTRGSR